MESTENREQPRQGNELEGDSNSSLSKAETLKLLNDSIDRIKQTIKGVSEDSAPLPASDSIHTLSSTTQKLADAVIAKPIPKSAPIAEATVAQKAQAQTKPAAMTATATSAVSPTEKRSSVQPKQQPVKKNPKKQIFSLIAVGVAAIAIVVVAIFWLWLPRQQANLSSVSEPTTTETIANPDLPAESALKTPSIEQQSNDSQTDSQRIPVETPVAPESRSESEPLVTPIPQDLESPGRAKNLKMVTIKPELNFTPEQTLIAALEKKISELTQDYPSDLIDSIQVNLSQNSLLVKVTDHWYELDESRQNKLANEILKRSRNLSFSKLEFKDNAGTLIARNPVIGSQIIILQNSKIQSPMTINNQ